MKVSILPHLIFTVIVSCHGIQGQGTYAVYNIIIAVANRPPANGILRYRANNTGNHTMDRSQLIPRRLTSD